MSAAKFWILNLMALAVAFLVGLEVLNTSHVSALTEAVTNGQNNLIVAQRQQEVLRQLVQRIVNDSKNDPALVDLLSRHGVKINPPSSPAQSTESPQTPTH